MPFSNDPDSFKALWDSLPEPLRAALLTGILGILLLLRQGNERTWGRKLLDLLAGFTTGLILGSILHMMGYEPWVIWSTNVAIAYLGVDKVREIVDKVVDKVMNMLPSGKGA